MSMTSIEWTDCTWNPVRGCSRVSEGCRNCYAERIAARFSNAGSVEAGEFVGFAERTPAGPRWTGRVELIKSKLQEPLHWKKPRRVFVNSMSDLFHESLPDDAILEVFRVMQDCPQHIFQVLTKRPENMRRFMAEWEGESIWEGPVQNVWLGVSVEDQKTADERIPLLLQTPAAVRFVSYEPALGPVCLLNYLLYGPWSAVNVKPPTSRGLDWVICGGESGPGARPFDIAWARSVRDQCKAAGGAFFMKQLGAHPFIQGCGDNWLATSEHWPHSKTLWDGSRAYTDLSSRKGGSMEEWPEDLRIREFPEVR